MSENLTSRMPWWIWIAAFILLQLVSMYSIYYLHIPGVADVYLTVTIGIVLIYWLGPRVLILVYLNSWINEYHWGHEFWGFKNMVFFFSFGIPETIFIFLSWYLFIKIAKGKYWLPDLVSLIKFITFGVAIPLFIHAILLKLLLNLKFHEPELGIIWDNYLIFWLGDFMPSIVVSLPILYFLSKKFKKWSGLSTKSMFKLRYPN